MKKNLLIFGTVVALSSTLGLISCEKSKDIPGDPVDIKLTGKQKEVVGSANDFAFELFSYAVAGSKGSENIMISPFSVSSALTMTLNGAVDETYDGMLKTLSLEGKTLSQINNAYLKLMNDMVSVDDRVVMNIANSVWIDNRLPVKQSFVDSLTTYFNAEARNIDMLDAGTPDVINTWIEDKTNNKIQDMLSQLDPETAMLLINAIYFNGKWKYQFDKGETTDRPFYLSAGNPKAVPTMTNNTTYNNFKDGNVTLVDLPYGQGNYTMVVVLPDEGVTLSEVASSLDAEKWSGWIDNLSSHAGEITLYMPKFEYEYTRNLNDDLKAMGMSIAFTDAADFSNIADEDLLITDVLHKTYIKTDEEGTEAAAATVVVVGVTSVGPENTIELNRPFLYFIREISTGTIVFAGTVEDPGITEG